MRDLFVNYEAFSLVFGKAPVFYVQVTSSKYDLIAVTDHFSIRSSASGSDATAFETTFKASSVQVENADEALLRGLASINVALISSYTRDGKIKTQPVTVDAGQWHNWHGIGDSNSALRQGPLMGVRLWWETIATVRTMRYQILNPDHTIGDPTNVDGDTFKMRWRYKDPVWLAGGRLRHLNARLGDAVSMRVIAPQADLTPNGFNEGNCDVISGLVVPASGDGAYDVDFSLSAPVDAPGVDGMYDFTFPASGLGRGTIIANGSQTGYYNLYAVDVPLTEFISHDLLLGNDILTYDPQNINASLVLAEYMFECELFKPDPGDDTPLEVVWRVLATRYRTT
jgi:hypothetical protein